MDKHHFNKLVQSVKEMKLILKGKLKPPRVTKFDPVSIKAIRQKRREIAEQDIIDGTVSGDAVISAQVLSEFFVTVTQKIKEPLTLPKAETEAALLSRLEVISLDVFLVQTAIQLQRKHRLSYWDSLILACAIKGRCAEIHSEDFVHGRRYEGVVVKNIFL